MPFDAVRRLIAREPVLAGMDRMQPAERTLVNRLIARFAEGDARPWPAAEEGAALALWGTDAPEAFLAWHAEAGVARALEVLLAALAYQRVTYEWDGSVWALRRTRPVLGLFNLRLAPWLWMRERVAGAAAADREAARAIAGRARAWPVRAALAYVFPDDPERWTADDAAEARWADVDERTGGTVHAWFGVLAAMRREPLDHARLRKPWRFDPPVPAAEIARALGDRAEAVAPLRLVGAYDELASLARRGVADALRALAELADRAWDQLAALEPTRETLAALAPMFTRLRPRRVLGLPLARALFEELVVAAPDAAAAVASSDSPDAAFVAGVIAETGAALPADEAWVSPWAAPRPAARREPRATPAPVAFAERIHWAEGEREALAGFGSERRGKGDRGRAAKCLADATGGQVLMIDLRWLADDVALATWNAIAPRRWYGQADDVQHLLARFGLAELPSILAFVRGKPEALAGLANVESPRVAPVMARGFALLAKHRATGKAWLDRFPEAAAVGLVADPGGDKKQRGATERALAYLARHHAAVVGQVLRAAGIEATPAELARQDTPALPARRPKLPAFVELARLPRPIRRGGGAALAGEPLGEFVQLLKATLPGGHPAVDEIAERYLPDSLARFAFGLFRQWLFAGAPPKDKWALHAVGKFPDDEHARALGRLARVWAPQGNSARAQEAVETLAMMRTPAALAEIEDIARKVQSRALAARAEKVFETVAEASGITADELADRLVPELSEHDLAFGELRVELDARLEPRLVTAAGAPAEPAFDKDSDDARRWKDLVRLCRSVARGQLARLELAMAEAHRMAFEHFAEVYQMHSLIRHLARSLLWGAYRDGELAVELALGPDGPVDVRGAPIVLPVDARYGVVHPIELTADERAAWTRRLPDQPFPQLAREVFAVADRDDLGRRLASFTGRTVETAHLLALLRRGWRRGDVVQGGTYYTVHRAGEGWSAELAFEPGIYLGSPNAEATQVLDAVAFRAEVAPPLAVISELLRDLAALG